MQIAEANLPSSVVSDADRQKVREQMNRLLETHHFKNSRRYPALLRFIVEETLEGRGEYLKERLLGVRVFDRPADYDTATDPIVRVTIAEIRKRIAQYYHDEEHDTEIRIELLPGRYAPEFRPRRDSVPDRASTPKKAEIRGFPLARPALLTEPPVVIAHAVAPARARLSHKSLYAICFAAALVLLLASVPAWRWMRPAAAEQLWAPILSSPNSVLFCLPTDVGKKSDPAGTPFRVLGDPSGLTAAMSNKVANASNLSFLAYESLGENVVYSDMLAAMNIGNVMATHHHDYRVRLNVSTTLEDLRQGPAILIGGLDNQWTMRALAPLRYHFAGSDEDRYWIADRKSPKNKDWSLDLKQTYAAVTRDYAIIARLHNEQTGQPEMIVAGIGMTGTAAGGEFVADKHRVEELRQKIGAGFKDRDFEVVLSTDVVNGIAGSPKILAVSVW